MPKPKKTSFWDHKQGLKNVGSFALLAAKEYSSIPAYAMRELSGQPHTPKKCTLKKRWFE